MSYRYSKYWAQSNKLGMAITKAIGWQHAVPRVGNLFPGITTPLPIMYPVSLMEACDNTTKYLVDKYTEFYVMWSGGVDSTLVICMLLKHRKPNQRITITLSTQAISDADPILIDKFKEYGCLFEEIYISSMKQIVSRGGIVLSGYHADSILIGELVDKGHLGDCIFDMNPVELLSSHMEMPVFVAEQTLKDLEPLLQLMPFERTAANIAWWLDFTCCWERDEYDLMYRFNLDQPNIGYYNFFSSDDFQRWSWRPAHEKVGRTKETHKEQYKSIVTSILGVSLEFRKNIMDLEIYDAKGVVNIFSDKLLAINEDYSVIIGA